MSSVAIRLRNSLPEISRAIRRGRVPVACRDDLLTFLPAALRSSAGRAEAVNEVRKNLSRQIRAGVLAAADRALTEPILRVTTRREWPGIVWRWLSLRYEVVGLRACPCRKTIRAALNEWEPQNRNSLRDGVGCKSDKLSNRI
jgi:hypothetical protein